MGLPSFPPNNRANDDATSFGLGDPAASDTAQLAAGLVAAYPSEVYPGWTPPPPSQEAAAKASPLMRLGLSLVYPDLFGHLASPPADQDVQDGIAAGGQDGKAPGPTDQILPPQQLQLAPWPPTELAKAPQLADVSADGLDFEPMYLGVGGAAAFGRVGVQRNGAGMQSVGGPAVPGHATPGGQVLGDSRTPSASVDVSSPSADELSLKPVVQNGRLQMAIYDDTTREKWVVDSTPGQSATVRNVKGEPIRFTSIDLTAAKSGAQGNPLTDFATGLKDSEADQNLLSVRSDGSVLAARNWGYQEPKLEAALGLGGLVKDVVAFGGGKLAAAAGIGRSGGRIGGEAEAGLEEGPALRQYGFGGGHHVPAKSVLRGANGFSKWRGPAIPKDELARLKINHGLVTKAQLAGYRALARSGVPLTWEAVEEVETNALVHAGMKPSAARATVQRAIKHLREPGVVAPTRYPGST